MKYKYLIIGLEVMQMIYWNDYDRYVIIEDVSLEELSEKHDVVLYHNDYFGKESMEWFNYAHVVAERNGFNEVYEACFIYYVTLFFVDDGISARAEETYFRKSLDKRINELYFHSSNHKTEHEQKRFFFNSLVDLFMSKEMEKYERKIFQHSILVSEEIKEWFSSKDSVRDTIAALMDGFIEKPHLNMNKDTNDTLVFLLSYSEESRWRELSNISDGDRLRVLLY